MGEEFFWCLIANVREETAHGPGGETKEIGTKHFSPGTKVYCLPPWQGDGYECIKVLARHRGSPKLVQMVLKSKHLTNWRVQAVFHPYVVHYFRETGYSWTEDSARAMCESLKRRDAGAEELNGDT